MRIGLIGAVLALHGGAAAMVIAAMDSQPKPLLPPTETLTIQLQDPEPEPAPPPRTPAPAEPEKPDVAKPVPKPVVKPRPAPKPRPDLVPAPLPAASEPAEATPAAAPPAAPPVPGEARAQPKPPADLPTMLTCQKPPYPVQSRRARETGTVEVMLLVDREGRVTEKAVARSSGHPALDRAALEGLARCQFKPGTIDGRVEPAWLRLRYVWKLE